MPFLIKKLAPMAVSSVFCRPRNVKPLERYVPEPFHIPRRLKHRQNHNPFQSSKTPNALINLKSLRRAVWEQQFGKHYSGKCVVEWCSADINVWNFHSAHVVARSLGGTNELSNLVPMCAECNSSMGTASLKEWNTLGKGNHNHTTTSMSDEDELNIVCMDEHSDTESPPSKPSRKRRRTRLD
jgi:5-methylcytosine-specific restriction endonuclease McrA